VRRAGGRIRGGRICHGAAGAPVGLDVIMVEKAPLFGGRTAYSAGVVWIPINAAQRAAGLTEPRQAALDYLAHHVSNRLDRARAEAFLDNAPAMFDCFAREGLAVFSLLPTWADYYPDEPGALRGGRSLGPETFDGRRLRSFFPNCTQQDHDGVWRHDDRPQRSAAHLSDLALAEARRPCRPYGEALRA
jgi:hypothetical protein